MPQPHVLKPVPMFADNYLWLRISPAGAVLAVDPGDYALLSQVLQEHDWRLATVLVTHHHADHCAGLPELRQMHPRVPVYGPESVEGVTHTLYGGETLDTGDTGIWQVLTLPGHTRHHLAYYHESDKILFCGDTLFSGGCGRIFDGDAQSLFHSLELIAALPDDTQICCSHEYTLSNLQFAQHIEPANIALQNYRLSCLLKRNRDEPTLPVLLSVEKAINPFLRTALPSVQERLAELLPDSAKNPAASEVFAALRRYKDDWKPPVR